mgnify:CR=1 FL=1|jgi:hypothetical protein
MKGKWNFIYLNPIVWFLVIWLFSLGKCELLTLLHGSEFSNQAMYENTMLPQIGYVKVLSYTKNYARIYIVSENRTFGTIIGFARENGKWKYNKWEKPTWSVGGTADDIIWPYWWHFFYHMYPKLN